MAPSRSALTRRRRACNSSRRCASKRSCSSSRKASAAGLRISSLKRASMSPTVTTATGRLGLSLRAAPSRQPLASPSLELPPTISDFERRAAEVLPPGPHGYFAGGACDEITLRDNVAAWQRLALRPRMMVDCTHRDPSTTVLGRRHAHPLIVAPTAFHALATPDGET